MVEDLSLAGFERSDGLQLVGGERSPSGPPPPGHRDRPRLANSNDTVAPVRPVEVWSRSCCTSPRRGLGRRSCTPPDKGVVAPVPYPAQSASRFVRKPPGGSRNALVRTGLSQQATTPGRGSLRSSPRIARRSSRRSRQAEREMPQPVESATADNSVESAPAMSDVSYALIGDGSCILLPGGVDQCLNLRRDEPQRFRPARSQPKASRAARAPRRGRRRRTLLAWNNK